MARRSNKRSRVFSVGYQELEPAGLKQFVEQLDVTLIDVRSRPSGRVKKEFSRADLEKLLGDRYEWRGDCLGGLKKKPTPEGLRELATDPRRLMLMCQEHSPGDCHRFSDIAVPLLVAGVEVWHVFEDEVISTELNRAIDDDTEYEFMALSEVLAEVAKAQP
jgi:hypothetical protein